MPAPTSSELIPVPPGARCAARIIVVSEYGRVFLLRAEDRLAGRTWWMAPGGGLEAGESFEAAARRELMEETGWNADLGPCVWIREHRSEFEGRAFHQYERFFVARVTEAAPGGCRPDGYVTGWRWWSEAELAATSEVLAPRQFTRHIGPLLRGEVLPMPIDVGV